MSARARFFVHIGLLLDEQDEITAQGGRGMHPELVRYWSFRHREEAACLIGYFA